MRRAINTAHLGAVVLAALVIGVLFLQEPVLGDDLTYWSSALHLHERGLNAWGELSFYDLRWPVWGVCWWFQAIVGIGLISYFAAALIYLAAGAILSFSFGKRLTDSVAIAWACALGFIFHPFLDAVRACPMPDISEGVWGAAAMLAWWKLMHATNRKQSWISSAFLALFVVIIEANRATGVFIVPVLALCTTLFFRRRFVWLVAAGIIALLLYGAECAFYHHLFGDWLHDLTANAHNKGAKGTEFPNPWLLPFRFFNSFWHEPLARLYSGLALIGIACFWRKGRVLERVMIVWFVLLLLEYSCTPQSLSPIRPLVRDAPRFLACLALPMTALAVLGLRRVLELVRQIFLGKRLHALGPRFIQTLVWLIAVASLFGLTKREFFNLGFVPQFRRYLASVPNGAKIFTHTQMRDIVTLIEPRTADRLDWHSHGQILEPDAQLERDAASCDEFWYERNLAWLVPRQKLERNPGAPHPALASYFAAPENEWALAEAIIRKGMPDLVLQRRRSKNEPSPQTLELNTFASTTLPLVWERSRNPDRLKTTWSIPDAMKQRLVRLEFDAASNEIEAFSVRLRFSDGKRKQKEPFILKPYLTVGGGSDFFALRIPAHATSCEIQLRFAEKTQRVEVTRFRAVLDAETAR